METFLSFSSSYNLRDLSSSIENGNKIARSYGIAIQFLFGSFRTAYVFIMYNEQWVLKFNTWKEGIKKRDKNFKILFLLILRSVFTEHYKVIFRIIY